MDFFAAQDEARRRTVRLVWLFAAAVVAMVITIYLAFMILLIDVGRHGWWDAHIFGFVVVGVLGVVGVSSVTKILSLRSGGSAVVESVGGRRIDPRKATFEEKRLLNIVEEMSIASGVPVPAVYVLPDERTINAFAAGFTPDDAAVAFTRGSLEKLNREELQGVVAHEFSHILNGDMRLNIHLIGVLFGILVLGILGRTLIRVAFIDGRRHRGRNSREGAGVAFVVGMAGMILVVVGGIGVFFGRLIQSAVSRQREYLADAAAAQFTRNPQGLAGALRKIGGSGSRVQHPHCQDVAHLFFANGLRKPLAGMFATHPPIGDRILALDPAWDGKFVRPQPAVPAAEPPPLPQEEQPAAKVSPVPSVAGAPMMAGMVVAADALARAQGVREEIESRCGEAVHDPLEARALVFALLIADSLPPARPGQLDYLRGSAGAELEEAVERRMKALGGLPEEARLALIELVLPALSRLEGRERLDFLQRVRRVVAADGQVTWFAFAAGWMVRRHLEPPPHLRPVDDPKVIAEPAGVLLGFLAGIEVGEDEAPAAVERAVAGSTDLAGQVRFPSGGVPSYDVLEDALRVLSSANFALRREVLAAAERLIADDGVVSPAEREVLRLVAVTLDCPAPLPSRADGPGVLGFAP